MSLDEQALGALRRQQAPDPGRYRPAASRRRLIWALPAVLAAVALFWWFAGDEPQKVELVEAAPPLEGGVVAVLSASGYVVAERRATVSAKVTGRVSEILFEEGAEVEAGQVLARLDDRNAEAARDLALRQYDAARLDVREVEIRLAEARRELGRVEQLRAEQLISAAALDQASAEEAALAARLEGARAAVSVARAAVQVRERELEDLVVRAPFGGVVVFKDAQPGEMVSPISAGGGYTRTGIASVVDMQSLEIHVDVNEAYLNRVAEGQFAEAVLDAYPDWKIAARVRAIVPTADRQKATVRVRVAFDALDSRILPDMGAKVRFLSQADAGDSPPVALVPAGAIMERSGEASVWRVEEGLARRVTVRVGTEAEGRRAILAGLAPGDQVVVDPPDTLTEGMAVSARTPD